MKKIKIILIIVLIIGFLFGAYSAYDMIFGTDKDASSLGATLESGIRDIGELSTAEYYYTQVVNVKDSDVNIFGKSVNIPFLNSQLICSYSGTIKAGIDFTGVTVNVDVEKQTITISLPEVTVISNDIIDESFEAYYKKNNAFVPLDQDKVEEAKLEMKTEEEKKALESGLLDRADENAKLMIESFAGTIVDVSEYKVIVE